MTIDSKVELRQLFEENKPLCELNEYSYSKSRYVTRLEFDSLIQYKLDFEPYLEIARRCSMSGIYVMRSPITNRFYIGFINLGGHGAMWEVRPVRIKEVEDASYIERMLKDHGQQLDWGIDLNENYKI